MDRGAWWPTAQRVTKRLNKMSQIARPSLWALTPATLMADIDLASLFVKFKPKKVMAMTLDSNISPLLRTTLVNSGLFSCNEENPGKSQAYFLMYLAVLFLILNSLD